MRLITTQTQGREMAMHKALSRRTGIAVQFFDPHSPWQRGSNENMNGLVRQYLPQVTDLSIYSQEQPDAISVEINGRPRESLGERSPTAVYRESLLNSPPHSNLIHSNPGGSTSLMNPPAARKSTLRLLFHVPLFHAMPGFRRRLGM
jgi:hypothetical protein